MFRNELAEASNSYIGPSVKLDNLQKRARGTLNIKPKEMKHPNKIIGAIVKTTKRQLSLSIPLKDKYPPLTQEITVNNNKKARSFDMDRAPNQVNAFKNLTLSH